MTARERVLILKYSVMRIRLQLPPSPGTGSPSSVLVLQLRETSPELSVLSAYFDVTWSSGEESQEEDHDWHLTNSFPPGCPPAHCTQSPAYIKSCLAMFCSPSKHCTVLFCTVLCSTGRAVFALLTERNAEKCQVN